MTQQTLPNTDVIDTEFLEAATTREGPWVSVFLPTHRTGREVLAARSQYNNLLKLAEQQLVDNGADDVEGLLAEARQLGEGQDFWQTQSDGLAVFAAPGFTRAFRLPMDLPDEVFVGDHPRLHPVAELLSGSGVFYVLALSQHSVRLFEGTAHSYGELDLGDTPRTIDDLEGDRDPQAQLQSSPQSRGGDRANFHGHGGGGGENLNKQLVERFFRGVGQAVDGVLGRTATGPLVLASVAEHHATYKAVTAHQNLLDEVVPGNPDEMSAAELHDAAWPLVEKTLRTTAENDLERLGSMIGTGKASEQLDSVQRAAAEGRVDTLILTPEPTRADGQAELVEDPADAVIIDVLRNRGRVVVIDEPDVEPVRAIYRY